MKTRIPNVYLEPDRHGKLRARYRKGRVAKYMKTLPDQPGFEEELKAITTKPIATGSLVIPRSVDDLINQYYLSPDYRSRGGDDDKLRRRRLLESFRKDHGKILVKHFNFQHIERILLARAEKKTDDRGRIVGGEVAATNLRKILFRLFRLAKKLEWITSNPVEDADRVGKLRLTGIHTWTEAEITQYKRRHPMGTKARLALEIILWTLLRRGDARLFGPQHVIRGKINFKASKNGMDLWLPIAQDLRMAITAMPSVGIKAYLVSELGKPFSKGGFGVKMREWCDEAGLPQCSAHGLRKAATRRMAESKATNRQMMAVGGWVNEEEVSTYAEAADREVLAEAGMATIMNKYSTGDDSENV